MRLEAVRAQLRGYVPADETEAGYVARMIELTSASAPVSRAHFVPGHFTASAFVLSPDRRKLMLIHHAKLGIWVQPGGHVEANDDDLLSTAKREVAEEVSLAELDALVANGAVFDVDIHAIPARQAEPAHEHFDVRFVFIARTQQFSCSEEARDARWVPLGEVRLLGTDTSVLRAVSKLRQLLG